ncbi:MAG: GNAT family N-acetyltransferase [Paracoccaceae bacterium]
MTAEAETGLKCRLARDEADLEAAQRLRYQVFVEELGATGRTVDHARRMERDDFDEVFEHLLLIDESRPARGLGHVVGAYRLLTSDQVAAAGRFYSEEEFDLGPLKASGRKLVELGRSCVHPDHRGGASMLLMWNGVAEFVLERGIEVMFGAASFHGTDPAAYAHALSLLHHNHLAPPPLRVRARPAGRQEMALLAPADLVRVAAMEQVPALIRGYLRLGGFVGDGAFVDRDFNTIDVCLVMDTERMSARHREFYMRRQGREA